MAHGEITMIGKTFGDWIVLSEVKTGKPAKHYECQCKCGSIKVIRNDGLKSGRSARCAECRHKNLLKIDETIGKRFGKWTTIEVIPTARKSFDYLCVCDCGEKSVVSGNALRGGRSQQCLKCSVVIHGMEKTSTYNSWRCMKRRCNSKSNHNYKYYGARGIKVCERWHIFKNFLDDMGEKPEGLQLDRIDVNGDYCKENCRWVTPKENSANRRPYKTVNMYTRVK